MIEALKKKLGEVAAAELELTSQLEAEFQKFKLPEDERNIRFDICKSCEFLFKPTNTCKKCGCFMAIKTYMPSQKCPIGKW